MEDKRVSALIPVRLCPSTAKCAWCANSILVRMCDREEILVCNFTKGCDGKEHFTQESVATESKET